MKFKSLLLSLFLSLIVYNLIFFQNHSESLQRLNQRIEETYQTFKPTGLSVAVIKDGKPVLMRSFGIRSQETGEKATNQSLYNIASCTKPFTSAAIAMLVQQGKVKWDDKVREYIPELKLGDPFITENLTIEDILSHRSGLITFMGDLLWYQTDYTNEEIIERMEFLPIDNQFRADYGYQNNMFMIAGEIVERVSGKTWSDFVQQEIFNPLEMSDSRPSNDELMEDDEIAYPHLKGRQVELYDFNATKPAASIMSNVNDLSHWVELVLNEGVYKGDTLLQPGMLTELMSPRTSFKVSKRQEENGTQFRAYALGWSVFDYYGVKVAEHNGGMPGYITKVSVVPGENLGVVVLNNGFDFFTHEVILHEVLDHYLKPGNEKDWIQLSQKQKENYTNYKENQRNARLNSRISGTRPSLKKEQYTGKYKDQMYGKATISIKERELFLTLEPAGDVFSAKMKHWHHDTYRVDFDDPFLPFGLITFRFNSRGEVESFKIDLPSNDFHFDNLKFSKI